MHWRRDAKEGDPIILTAGGGKWGVRIEGLAEEWVWEVIGGGGGQAGGGGEELLN